MTIKHLFPTAKPTLDFNFAAERQLDPRITFTRSSIGTYIDEDGILQYAAEDEPRFDHDPITGESLGLLTELARTNSIEFSEDFSVLSQLNNGDGVPPVLDGTLYEAPDGSLTAQRWTLQITDTTDAGNQSTLQASATGIPAAAYVTVWAKSATGADQTVFLTSDANDAFTVTNRWQRFDLGPRGTIPFRCAARGTYTDAVVDVLLWGLQAEEGTFPTSYIPTSGTTEQRAQDISDVDASIMDTIQSSDGNTIIMKTRWTTAGANQATFVRTNQLNVNQWRANRITGMDIGAYYSPIPGEEQYNTVFAAADSTYQVIGNNAGAFASEALGRSASSAPLRFGVYANSQRKQTIARIAFYPRRLSDEQLRALTA
jgi:hypothetical protein